MDSQIAVALITSVTGITIALIGAIFTSERAVTRAVATKNEHIAALKAQVIGLGGTPYEPED